MKILLLDIETSPNEVYVWELFKQYSISVEQVKTPRRVLCWGAKWYGDEKFLSGNTLDGEVGMLNEVRGLMDDADVIVHYNGTQFDIPILNSQFLRCEMGPPSPYKQVDLMQTLRRAFRFPSSKLKFIAGELELGKKLEHEGLKMWKECMAGDKAAMKRMLAYNKQDVLLLEKLYVRLLPWIDLHPNYGAYSGTDVCPACGSKHFHSRGTVVTHAQKYTRFQCQDCGKWFRGSKPLNVKRELGTRNVKP